MLIQTQMPCWNLCISGPMSNAARSLLTECVKKVSFDGVPGFSLWTKSSFCTGENELEGVSSGGTIASSYAAVPKTKIPCRARNSAALPHASRDCSWSRVSQSPGCWPNTFVCFTQGLKYNKTKHKAPVTSCSFWLGYRTACAVFDFNFETSLL